MCPGNPLGDYAQRAIGLPLILKPVVANEDGVGVATPLTDQCRARFERGAQIGGRAALFALSGQSLQAALQCPAGSAIALLLELMNEGSDQQIATEPLGWFDTMQSAPGKAQIVRRPMCQSGDLAVDRGHNSAPRINVRVAALTGNGGRLANVLAGRIAVVWRFHALAGSVMR
jgi:hypothetical protein